MNECFKVYFSTKSWFLKKYKSGILHGYKMKISDVKFKFPWERNVHDVSECRKFLYRNKIVNLVSTNTKLNFPSSGSLNSCEAATTGEARMLKAEMVSHIWWSGRLLMLDYSMNV